jgi:hypothetical protein
LTGKLVVCTCIFLMEAELRGIRDHFVAYTSSYGPMQAR